MMVLYRYVWIFDIIIFAFIIRAQSGKNNRKTTTKRTSPCTRRGGGEVLRDQSRNEEAKHYDPRTAPIT